MDLDTTIGWQLNDNEGRLRLSTMALAPPWDQADIEWVISVKENTMVTVIEEMKCINLFKRTTRDVWGEKHL